MRSVAETPSTMQWCVFEMSAQPAIAETLGDPHLPERLCAIELLGHHPPHQIAQLFVAPGGREGGAPHVILEVEVWIVDPRRTTERQRHEPHLLPIPWHLRSRPATAERTSPGPGAGPSKIPTEPMCMCVTASSI